MHHVWASVFPRYLWSHWCNVCVWEQLGFVRVASKDRSRWQRAEIWQHSSSQWLHSSQKATSHQTPAVCPLVAYAWQKYISSWSGALGCLFSLFVYLLSLLHYRHHNASHLSVRVWLLFLLIYSSDKETGYGYWDIK